MLNNLLHLKKNNGDKKIPKTLEFTKGFHENPTNILSFKRHQPTIIRVLKKKQEIKTKFLQKSFLSASVKQKFKKILNEFNNNKYQAEKWTSKTYEKEQNRTYTKNSTQFSANCELPVLFKDETKENVSLILRKKREVDERLFEISARLKEYSRNTLPKNKILGENKIGLKCSDLYHILLRLDQKNDNFPDLFKKLKNQTFHEFVTPQKVKNEENRRGYSTGLKNSKYRNNNLELNKAISLWEVSKKQKKIVNKQLFKDYSLQIQKKRGIKELRKCLIAFLTKLKRLKLSPFEMLTQMKIFTSKPFEREGDFLFFKYVKKNDTELCLSMLAKKKYYIYDFNYNKETPLHLSIKYNFNHLSLLFIELGADLDAKDLVIFFLKKIFIHFLKFKKEGRTPLFLAIKQNNKCIIKALLYSQANPWNLNGFEYQTLCRNKEIILLIKTARRLDIVLKMTPAKYRRNLWLNKRTFFEQ